MDLLNRAFVVFYSIPYFVASLYWIMFNHLIFREENKGIIFYIVLFL